jgi:5-methylcytosine-specific restriction endonuclease McrA
MRKRALDKALVKDYHDPSRKRVTRWGKCTACNKLEPLYLLQIDHKEPIIPIDRSLDEMSWDEVVDKVWCDERNLQAVCKPCHKAKSKIENAERRRRKKETK